MSEAPRDTKLGVIGMCFALMSCGPKYPRALHDKATLVGIDEERKAHARMSWVDGRILRLDGRPVKLAKEELRGATFSKWRWSMRSLHPPRTHVSGLTHSARANSRQDTSQDADPSRSKCVKECATSCPLGSTRTGHGSTSSRCTLNRAPSRGSLRCVRVPRPVLRESPSSVRGAKPTARGARRCSALPRHHCLRVARRRARVCRPGAVRCALRWCAWSRADTP